MPKIRSKLDTSSPAFKANAERHMVVTTNPPVPGDVLDRKSDV